MFVQKFSTLLKSTALFSLISSSMALASNGYDTEWKIVDRGNGFVQFKNRLKGYCLDGEHGTSHGKGWDTEVSSCYSSSISTQWKLEQQDNGYFTVKNRSSGYCLAVRGVDNHQKGTDTEVHSCTSGMDRLWELVYNGQGYHILKNNVSDYCMGVKGTDSHSLYGYERGYLSC